MALSIKDAETDGMVRRLATARRLSYTAAIKLAVGNELEREQLPKPIDWAAIDAIVRETAALPVIDDRSCDEIIGYDENGLPT